MKRIALFGLCAAISILPAAAAKADSQQGPFYIGTTASMDFPANSNVGGATNGTVKYNFSSGGDVAIGWQPQVLNTETGDVRLEVQGGYHAFGLKSITANGATNSNPSGDMKAATLMTNAYYDLHTGTRFTPYVGVGVGEAMLKFPEGEGLGNTDSTSYKLAYQGMAGVAYTPEPLPQADITLGYRYLGTEKASYGSATGDVNVGPLNDSAVEVGFRYHL